MVSPLTMIARPSDFSPDELLRFRELVEVGGEVDPVGLSGRILKAHLLGMSLDGEEIVSVGALKNTTLKKRVAVFKDADVSLDPEAFLLELGWVFTELEFRGRGHCSKLLTELLSTVAGNIFATARVGNTDIHHIMKKFAFAPCGKPYPGRTELIQLFIRK